MQLHVFIHTQDLKDGPLPPVYVAVSESFLCWTSYFSCGRFIDINVLAYDHRFCIQLVCFRPEKARILEIKREYNIHVLYVCSHANTLPAHAHVYVTCPAQLKIAFASFNCENQDSYHTTGFFSYWLSSRPYCHPTFDVFGHWLEWSLRWAPTSSWLFNCHVYSMSFVPFWYDLADLTATAVQKIMCPIIHGQ